MPKLNLKAVVRLKDVPLNLSFDNEQPSSSQEKPISRVVTPENIIVESQPADVKSPLGEDEISTNLNHHNEYEFNEDEEVTEFKSSQTHQLNNKYQEEFSEDEYSADNLGDLPLKDEPHPEDSIVNPRLADLVHLEDVEHSLLDADSCSVHSNTSDPYKQAALQITHQQQQRSQATLFTSLKDPPTQSSNTTQNEQQKLSTVRRKRKIAEDPTTMPLCDRLFFNPPLNIFQVKEREDSSKNTDDSIIKVPLPVTKKRRSSRTNSIASQSSNRSLRSRGSVDTEENVLKSGDEISEKDNSTVSEQPLLILDESGNIVINNPAQIATENEKKPEVKMQSSTTYNSFRRRQRPRNTWNSEDTSVFYCALEKVGTDFSLMEAIYFKNRGRDRKQLKQKFKREEKVNREFVDKVLFKSLINQSYNVRMVQEHLGCDTSTRINENKSTDITA